MTQWHIALIEPQAENLASQALRARGYEPYYPSFPKTIQRGRGHSRITMRPMFPGYIFVVQPSHGWERLRTAPGVRVTHSLLMINGAFAKLPSTEIDKILIAERELCSDIAKPKIEKLPYGVGDTVRLTEGVWMGFTAQIVTLDDAERIGLLMSLFGRESRVIASHEHLAAL